VSCGAGLLAAGLHIQNATQVKQQLQQALDTSKARWKVVVGHHPIASFGKHCDFHMEGDCEELAFMKTMLQVGGLEHCRTSCCHSGGPALYGAMAWWALLHPPTVPSEALCHTVWWSNL
jgi:hypothetical protein